MAVGSLARMAANTAINLPVKVLTPAEKIAARSKIMPKPKFKPKLRVKLELQQRKYGNIYTEMPKTPEDLAEMQSTFKGRKTLVTAARNDAEGKRFVRNTQVGFGTLMTGAIAVGQYQESERKKLMKKANAPMGKPKSRLAPTNPGKVVPKQMPMRGKPKAKARKA